MITVLIIAYLAIGFIIGSIVSLYLKKEEFWMQGVGIITSMVLWPMVLFTLFSLLMLWLMSKWVIFIKGLKYGNDKS